MSLDFSLYQEDVEVFSNNITHNLNTMAEVAGIYRVLWHPEMLEITKAGQCVDLLSKGLVELITHRVKYEEYNSPNGWGMYEHFVPFVVSVIEACSTYPDATVSVSI